jgi:hypothetical protein
VSAHEWPAEVVEFVRTFETGEEAANALPMFLDVLLAPAPGGADRDKIAEVLAAHEVDYHGTYAECRCGAWAVTMDEAPEGHEGPHHAHVADALAGVLAPAVDTNAIRAPARLRERDTMTETTTHSWPDDVLDGVAEVIEDGGVLLPSEEGDSFTLLAGDTTHLVRDLLNFLVTNPAASAALNGYRAAAERTVAETWHQRWLRKKAATTELDCARAGGTCDTCRAAAQRLRARARADALAPSVDANAIRAQAWDEGARSGHHWPLTWAELRQVNPYRADPLASAAQSDTGPTRAQAWGDGYRAGVTDEHTLRFTALVDDLRAMADEFARGVLGTDFFGNPLTGWVPVEKVLAILARHTARPHDGDTGQEAT